MRALPTQHYWNVYFDKYVSTLCSASDVPAVSWCHLYSQLGHPWREKLSPYLFQDIRVC
jgi:hypothetical protein